MRYFIYCRKSTDSEDRQVLSLESQLAELHEKCAAQGDIEIVDTYAESMSAKAPGRPLFNEMISRIQQGEAEGILAWHPDRLSRNSVDAGLIIYLLDRKIIQDLKFASYTFHDTPEGKLMLSTILSFSKYYSDALSKNVKRGNKTKLANGWWPNTAPLGYLNCKDTRTIIPDPERFPLVKQLWELMLTGCYTPAMLLKKARDEWGLCTPKRKLQGGRPLSHSGLYRLLRNPFYTGLFRWNGQLYQGKHEPMVSLADFERVQTMLDGKRTKPHTPKDKPSFTYTGLLSCGECGCMITAERKTNRFGSKYIYYHCTHRKTEHDCRQGSVELRQLETQIIQFLETITIPDELHELFMQHLDKNHQSLTVRSQAKVKSLKTALTATSTKKKNLTHIRLQGMIDDAEFMETRNQLEFEEKNLTQQLKEAENPAPMFEPFKNYLAFCNKAVLWFKEGNPETKRLILKTVCSNPVIRDKIFKTEAAKPFLVVPKNAGYPFLRAVRSNFRKYNGKNANWYGFLGGKDRKDSKLPDQGDRL